MVRLANTLLQQGVVKTVVAINTWQPLHANVHICELQQFAAMQRFGRVCNRFDLRTLRVTLALANCQALWRLTGRYFADRYSTDRYFIGRYFADRQLTDRYVTVRHMAYRLG